MISLISLPIVKFSSATNTNVNEKAIAWVHSIQSNMFLNFESVQYGGGSPHSYQEKIMKIMQGTKVLVRYNVEYFTDIGVDVHL